MHPHSKPFHFHQCIPLHSAYPPGITKATITGMLLSLWLHCANKSTRRCHANHVWKKLIESNHQTFVIKKCFQEASKFIHKKTNAYCRHEIALLSNKSDNKTHVSQFSKDVQSLTIPSPQNFLAFANSIEPSISNLFPDHAPVTMPMLETLCKCIAGNMRPLPVKSDLPSALFIQVLFHPRDMSRLAIRHLCDEHYEQLFKDKCHIDQFVICYHRDRHLKECLSPSSYR